MMDRIAILDFGAQYTQLIARRIRELGVYSEILPCTQPVEDVLAAGYTGIVLSGGPASVYDDEAPLPDKRLFEAGVPLLGICYGMQAMGYLLGGHVVPAERREYGPAELRLLSTEGLLEGIVPERDGRISVWMSHGDTVMQPPRGFVNLGATENCPVAAMADDARRLYAVQFHPEVAHTPQGKTVLRNFLRLCGARADWSMPSFVDAAVEGIRRQVGRDRVLCALSGGVDSSVVAALIHRAIGDQLTCLFVDNGLLRKGEVENVVATFRDAFKMNLIHVNATEQFLEQLKDVSDPEVKRKRIGAEFIGVFEERREASGISPGSPRARSIPTSSNPCRSRGRRRPSRRITMSAGCRAGCSSSWSSRCASCSRTRCASWARSSGCPPRSSGASPSRVRVWRFGCSGEVTEERLGDPARGRRRRPGGGARGGARARALAGLRHPPARANRGRDGGLPHLCAGDRAARGDEPGRHDGRLGPLAL
jgi:GMP synthase (glutamine-hydrolysing) A subunit